MRLLTLLDLLGFCFLVSAWTIHWTTDTSNEKISRIKIALMSIGMGIFLSATTVGLYQHFVK